VLFFSMAVCSLVILVEGGYHAAFSFTRLSNVPPLQEIGGNDECRVNLPK
jgi:hypothetical protein